MNTNTPAAEYLVISRGQWDASASKEDIQRAIDAFYAWHGRMVAEGRMKPGSRLMKDGKLVSRRGIIDGPYSEAKEVIGGYWLVYAHSLEEAALLLAQNPCLAYGLVNEVRELDPALGNAFAVTAETPAAA
ncbi:YciI family protein [Rudaea sp.]|uniref:YciI family protein n=1 Tax=Rudaea sp. TaxID=2136325 RepID=UPI00321F9F3D